MTAPAHPQRCKTCKHRVLVSTYMASENERCDIKDTRLTYEGKSLIKIVGCASHSSVQSRDQVLDDIEQRLIAIQAGTEPHDRISFKSVYQIINEHRTQGSRDPCLMDPTKERKTTYRCKL